MKANELRIGNWVELGVVVSIGKYTAEIKCREGYWNNKYDYIKPIPLNEEWLERFGFADGELGDLCVRPYETLLQGVFPGLWRVDLINSTIPYMIRRKIEYVHQLQNLYFALIGEELEIKEKVK